MRIPSNEVFQVQVQVWKYRVVAVNSNFFTHSLGDRSGLQADQCGTPTLFFSSHSSVMWAECGCKLSCWKTHWRSWNRCHLRGLKPQCIFALMLPSQKCAWALLTITEPGLNGYFLFFSLSTPCLFLPKKALEYWLVWTKYDSTQCDGPSRMPLRPEKSMMPLDKVNIWLSFGPNHDHNQLWLI